MTRAQAVAAMVNTPADAMLHALPHPVIMVSADGKIADANVAAEQFFEASTAMLRRHLLRELVPFGSPLLTLIEQVRQRGAAVNEYKVDLATPRNPGERLVDLPQDALLVLDRELPAAAALSDLRRRRGGSGLPDLLPRRRRRGLGRTAGTNPTSLGRSQHGYLRPPRPRRH